MEILGILASLIYVFVGALIFLFTALEGWGTGDAGEFILYAVMGVVLGCFWPMLAAAFAVFWIITAPIQFIMDRF